MEKFIKYIKFILLQISTIFIRYKWQAICALVSGVIMYIITFLRNTDIIYSIPIIIFVMGSIPWTILGCIKLYEFIINREELEIIYDNGKYNKYKNVQITATYDLNMPIHHCFFYVVGIRNISKKTINSISVIIDGNKCPHDSDGQYICDINPGSIELFDMYGETIKNQKQGTKITITVTGKDTKPTIKTIAL